MWKNLRERAENEQLYKVDLPEAELPPEVLMALLGFKGHGVSDGSDVYEVGEEGY